MLLLYYKFTIPLLHLEEPQTQDIEKPAWQDTIRQKRPKALKSVLRRGERHSRIREATCKER